MKRTKLSGASLLLILFVSACFTTDRNSTLNPIPSVSPAPSSQPGSPVDGSTPAATDPKKKAEIEKLAESGLLQEAIWMADTNHIQDLAQELKVRLRKELTEGAFKVEKKRDLIGKTEKIVFHYKSGISALFKPDGKYTTNDHAWAANAKSEVAAYEFDQIYGFNLVPMTVLYTYKGKEGSLQYWVKDSEPGLGKESVKFSEMEIFDYMIGNSDRYVNENNWLYLEAQNQVIAIDHGVAFQDFEAGCFTPAGQLYVGISDPCGEPLLAYPYPELVNLSQITGELKSKVLTIADEKVREALAPYVEAKPLNRVLDRLHDIQGKLR